MPSRSRPRTRTRTSPYAEPLARALASGTPFDAAVVAIARRRGRSPKQVLESLRKAGLSRVQRIAGEDVDLPTAEAVAGVARGGRSAKAARAAEAAAWRSIAAWLLASGAMTAEELAGAAGSRAAFLEAVGDAVSEGLLGRPAAGAAEATGRTPDCDAEACSRSAKGEAVRSSAARRIPVRVPADETRDQRLDRIRNRGLTPRKRRAA